MWGAQLFPWRGSVEVEILDVDTGDESLRVFRGTPQASEFLRLLGKSVRSRERRVVVAAFTRGRGGARIHLSTVYLDGPAGVARRPGDELHR